MSVRMEYELLLECIQLQLASQLYGTKYTAKSIVPLFSLLRRVLHSKSLDSSAPSPSGTAHMRPIQSIWLAAIGDRREVGALHTMYRRRSPSLSFWKRLRSWSTPALASLTSFSDTSSACSNYRRVSVANPSETHLEGPHTWMRLSLVFPIWSRRVRSGSTSANPWIA